MRLRWGKWLTSWATFKKRLPSLGFAATILLAMATDANVVAIVPERYHPLLRYLVGFCTMALLYTRSVATGAHGADYDVGLVPDRRGTGQRTGELPTAMPLAAPHSTADAGAHDDEGEAL